MQLWLLLMENQFWLHTHPQQEYPSVYWDTFILSDCHGTLILDEQMKK